MNASHCYCKRDILSFTIRLISLSTAIRSCIRVPSIVTDMNSDDFCQLGIRKLGGRSDNTRMIQRQTRMKLFHISSTYKSTSNAGFAVKIDSIVWKDNPPDNNFWFFENCCTPLECSALQKFPKNIFSCWVLYQLALSHSWSGVFERTCVKTLRDSFETMSPNLTKGPLSYLSLFFSFIPQEMNMQYVTNKICLIIGCTLGRQLTLWYST